MRRCSGREQKDLCEFVNGYSRKIKAQACGMEETLWFACRLEYPVKCGNCSLSIVVSILTDEGSPKGKSL